MVFRAGFLVVTASHTHKIKALDIFVEMLYTHNEYVSVFGRFFTRGFE
jgi:hypothetical protein